MMLDPEMLALKLGFGAMTALGGVSSAAGSYAAQRFDKNLLVNRINWGSVAGAGLFGMTGGAFQAMFGTYVGGGTLALESLSNAVGGIPSIFGDLAGGSVWSQSHPDATSTPWSPSTPTDWAAIAGGCKGWR